MSIVNPAQVKDVSRSLGFRTKTDGVDSLVLVRYGALLKPKPWAPPAPEASIRQALLSRREAISQDLQRERNRLEKANDTEILELIRVSLIDSIIPAVGPQVSNQLLAVMHNHQFQSAEQLAAYLGMIPVERQSHSSIQGRPRLPKAGPARIRAVLYMEVIAGT